MLKDTQTTTHFKMWNMRELNLDHSNLSAVLNTFHTVLLTFVNNNSLQADSEKLLQH